MRAGSLRQRFQLQAPVSTPDGMGGTVTNWVVVATIWGLLSPVSGAERLLGGQMTAIVAHEIDIRYRPGVVPKMRMVHLQAGSQTYEIHAVLNPEGRNKSLQLTCSEVQLQGA